AGHARPWPAVFRSTVAIALPDGEIFTMDGECRGEIIPEERGSGGFGYDPIFLMEGLGRTMAELSLEEKNRVSHRARAILAARPALRELGQRMK
ncbi:MAG: non-canonical purine NTP pyrophosphatase, partial [Leptolinea sp.]